MFKVEVLNIGTELLLGNVLNSHAAYLGRKLTQLGATITRQVCVNDTGHDIVDALKDAIARADLVITTGGLGPTSDDITRNIIAEHFDLKMKLDEKALQNIEVRFKRRGGVVPETTKVQAYVPEISTVLYNANGTAPGLMIPLGKIPKLKQAPCKWIVMLPGPPREMHPMFDLQVYPWLQDEFKSVLPVIDCRVLKVAGKGESFIAEKIEPVLADLKGLEIGYCARPNEVDVRLFVNGSNRDEVFKLADVAEKRTREVIGNDIFGSGNETLEEVIVKLLQAKHQTVATAESCTGGFLSSRITNVAGSSNVFRKGFVVYSNDAKSAMLGVPGHLIVEHGAVSEPVARSLAECAIHKAEADYAIGITGIAGPTGGSDDKPVGTVFIAVASKKDVYVEKQRYQYERETFKFVTTQTALNLLRKRIIGVPLQ